jgi:hypothetical protein
MARFVFSAGVAYDTLVSNVSELQTVLTNTGAAYNGQTIALAPGTYNLSSANFNNQPTNVTYISQFNSSRAVITNWNLRNANAAGSFTLRNVDIDHTLPSGDFQFWGPGADTTYSIINSDSGPFTAITLENIVCDGGMEPFLSGGRMIVDNAFLFVRSGTNITVKNCQISKVMSGVKIHSCDTFLIEGNTFEYFHADPINLLNAQGDCENGVIKNNHFTNPGGVPSSFHMDCIQFQPTSASGFFFRNIEIVGNTMAFGNNTPVAQVERNNSATTNSYSTSFSVAGTEHGQETRLTPSGNITVTMPSAVGNKGQQFNFRYSSGTGTVSFALNGSDTYNGGAAPSITAAGQFATFVSDGAGNWGKLKPGYRSWFLHRDYNFTGGDLEDGFVVMLDATAGNVTMTLPSAGTRQFNVQRIDNSSNTVTVTADGVDTITLNGTGGRASVTMTPGYGVNFFRTGDGNWTATECDPTFRFLFSNQNADNFENIEIHGNVYQASDGGLWIEDDVTDLSVHHNTHMPFILPDRNGDGYIGRYDGSPALYQNDLSGTGNVFNNFTAGSFDLGADGLTPSSSNNITLSISGSDPIPTSVTNHFNGTTRADYVATTRSELLTTALAKPGGPLDGTLIGALGTTISNGYYNFATGAVNP